MPDKSELIDHDHNRDDVLDAVGAFVIVLDGGGRILHWNSACETFSGIGSQQARGQFVWDLVVPPEERAGVIDEFERVMAQQRISYFENSWVTADGARRWIRWCNQRTAGSGGAAPQVVATGVDISDLKDYEDKLQVSEFNLRSILSTAADAIISVDEQQRIVMFNQGAEKIFGWTREEVVGQPLDMLMPEHHRGGHGGLMLDFGAGPDAARPMGSRSTPVRALRKNGEEFPAQAGISKFRSAAGDLFTVILRDISDQVALERALRQEIKARDEMARTIVHDLRNPLNLIGLQVQAIYCPPGGDERRSTELYHNIKRVIADTAQLLDDLLDGLRADAKQLPMVEKSVPVATLLDDALSNALPMAREQNITVRSDMPEDTLEVSVDRGRMLQVLGNLLGNAFKFTPAGGQVTLSAEEQADDVAIAVSDTGPGIPEELRQHLFEPFWQGNQGDRRGAGLGLTIAKSIVEAHGGNITVDSTLGVGTTITVSLRKAPA